MHRAPRVFILIACAAALGAQTPAASQPAQGMQPDWDVRVILREIGAHAARLLPALDRIDAQAWVEKGASETYVAQLNSTREQLKAISGGAVDLARNPDKLSAGLELWFRIEAVGNMLGSLEEGARRYQSPAAAQMLAGLYGEAGSNRERFRSYLVNLAAQREQEFDVMDREAQRCRGIVATQPPAPCASSGRKK